MNDTKSLEIPGEVEPDPSDEVQLLSCSANMFLLGDGAQTRVSIPDFTKGASIPRGTRGIVIERRIVVQVQYRADRVTREEVLWVRIDFGPLGKHWAPISWLGWGW